MSESLAYVAGLIDGDGSVGIACQKRGSGEQARWSYYASVTIGMTQPAKPILEWIHQEWGGSLHSHKTAGEKECPAWQWRVSGENAVTILRKLLPYLRLKGPQAKLALEVERIRASLPRTNNGGADWTRQSRAECERIKQKIHLLNAKGPGVRNAEDSCLPARPIAEWNPQTQLWETDQMDLFSGRREPYSPTWPISGMTRRGQLLPLEMSAHHIGASASSSSQLPTPTASDAHWKTTHAGGNLTLQGAVGGVHPKDAQRHAKAGREVPLLSSPVAQQSGSTPEKHLARKPGRTQVTDLAIIVENGLM